MTWTEIAQGAALSALLLAGFGFGLRIGAPRQRLVRRRLARHATDAEAIAHDWQMVGRDIRAAVEKARKPPESP